MAIPHKKNAPDTLPRGWCGNEYERSAPTTSTSWVVLKGVYYKESHGNKVQDSLGRLWTRAIGETTLKKKRQKLYLLGGVEMSVKEAGQILLPFGWCRKEYTKLYKKKSHQKCCSNDDGQARKEHPRERDNKLTHKQASFRSSYSIDELVWTWHSS